MEVARPRLSAILIAVGPDRVLDRALRGLRQQALADIELVIVHDRDDEPAARRRICAIADVGDATFIAAGRESPGATRNAGVLASRGASFVIIDGGEDVPADYLEKAVAVLEARDAGFVAALGARVPESLDKAVLPGVTVSMAWLLAGPWWTAAAVLVKRSVFDRVGGFDTSLPALVDWDFLMTLLERDHDGVLMPVRLGRHHSDDVRLREALRVERYLPSVRRIFEKHRASFERHAATVLTDRDRMAKMLWRRERGLVARRDSMRTALTGIVEQLDALRRELRTHGRRTLEFSDLRRPSPVSRNWGLDRGRPIDRHYIDAFVARHADDVHGDVLEVLDRGLTKTYGGSRVIRSDVLDIDAGNHRATVVADLRTAGQLPIDSYDCFILTQTLHLIDDMEGALTNACRALKPGGVLLATLPCVSMIAEEYGATGDHWRATKPAARQLFEKVFPPSHVDVESHGNVLATTAFLHGLSCDDVEPDELDANDPGYPLLITVRAVKPVSPRPVGSTSRSDQRAAILLYHRVASVTHDVHRLAVSPATFRSQLEYLVRRWRVLPLARLVDAAVNGEVLEPSVALTFDDGYLDNLENAAPILNEFGLPATMFVTSEALDRRHFFWWDQLERVLLATSDLPERLDIRIGGEWRAFATDSASTRRDTHDQLYSCLKSSAPAVRDDVIRQLRSFSGLLGASSQDRPVTGAELKELADLSGVTVGAHSVHHLGLPQLSHDDLYREVFECRSELERTISRPVTSFAYPFGDVSPESVEMVRAAGYQLAVSCEARWLHRTDDEHRLPRLQVPNQPDLDAWLLSMPARER